MDAMKDKLLAANEMLKAEVTKRSLVGSWEHTDWVIEDRFLEEIKIDQFDVANSTAEEIAEYAIQQIYE